MISVPPAHQRSNESQAASRKCDGTKPANAVSHGQAHSLDQSDARLLIREFTHRINNELTSAVNVITIAAARSRNRQVKQTLSEVQDRIQAYAEVHHATQMPEQVTPIDVAAYPKRICRAISCSKLDTKGIRLLFIERSFLMSCDRCWRLGLIVSELITNSARHAFGDGSGSIRVELMPRLLVIECRVAENGKGEKRVRTGRDCTIVDGLVSGLGGTITRRFGRGGYESLVPIPLGSSAVNDAICSPSLR